MYRYDPADPFIVMGGDWNGYPFSFAEGLQVAERYARQAAAQAQDEVHDPRERQDVLVFETEPLDEAIELEGWGEVVLWAASDGPDTDWFVDVNDIDPDGQRLPLSSGQLRARFRESLEYEVLLESDEPYEFRFELAPISHRVLPGHRIRVAGAS